jgi:hypothetical protein
MSFYQFIMPESWTGFRDIDEAMPTDIRLEDEED